jgi:xanthine dehydrogenase iron-sulfur cluster and FAD-binding subunit A
LRTVEAALAGATVTPVTVDRALAGLDQDIAPIDDIRSTGSYRILVTRNLLRHYLLNPDWPAGQG